MTDVSKSREERLAQLRTLAKGLNSAVGNNLLELIDAQPNFDDIPLEQPYEELPLSDAIVRAALLNTFTARDIDASDEELPSIARLSTSVTLQGKCRLQFSPALRASVIHRAREAGRFSAIFSNTENNDAVEAGDMQETRWLHAFLSGSPAPVKAISIEELRAAVTAREALADVTLPSEVPSLNDLQRRLGMAELLEPLRILIGSRGGLDGEPIHDRFAGRARELRELRSFVGELASESAAEAVHRGIEQISGSIAQYFSSKAPGAYVLEARGGLGKSSLIAKFVLDHTLNQADRFPFAYLDFDRAALEPREPSHLLSETMRQVALQFFVLEEEVTKLRSQLREQPSAASAVQVAEKFRDGLSRHLFSMGIKSFLLVLDTMEIVQSDTRALHGLIAFIDLLTGKEFPQLRIVAAGRADVPELRQETSIRTAGIHKELQPLSLEDGRAMANRLGQALLGTEWQENWGARLAGRPSDPATRREPLVIRVAVEFLRDTPPSERNAQSIELEKEGGNEALLGKLYERRVVNHVRDIYARKLAWPGVVFRAMTREIVAEVLAPLTGLPEERVDQAFEALGREIWIVQKNGDSLQHRPDLRARTLPLMYAHNRGEFERINREAIAYFEPKNSQPPQRAEWLYHRLLAGEVPAIVDQDWDEDVAPSLTRAAEDFAVLRPKAAAYIRARTAKSLLPADALLEFGSGLAYDHVARVAPYLGAFDDVIIEPVVMTLAASTTRPIRISADGRAAAAVMAIKTGAWDEEDPTGTPSGVWNDLCTFAVKYKRARTIEREWPDDLSEEMQQELASLKPAISRNSLPGLAQDFAAARILRLPVGDQLEKTFADRLNQIESSWQNLMALRIAGTFSRLATGNIAKAWVRCRQNLLSTHYSRTISGAEIAALFEGTRSTGVNLEDALAPSLKEAGMTLRDILKRSRDAKPLRIAERRVVEAVDTYVGTLAESDTRQDMATLRRFLSVRYEDWVIPFGYAAARMLTPHPLPRQIANVLRSYSPGSGTKHRDEVPLDPLQAVRFADEAGALPHFVDALRQAAGGDVSPSRLFGRLLARFKTWRQAIAELEETTSPETRSRNAGSQDGRPQPGPVVNTKDPQKNRWGGKAEHRGRRLQVILGEVKRNYFYINYIVSSTDDTPLEGPVVFHLHDTYPRSIIHIRKIHEKRWATLEEVSADGVYTVGVQVKDGDGNWIGLEYDLTNLKGLPTRFHNLY